MLAENIIELIGNTPILHCKRFSESQGAGAEIYAKLERSNPAGSAKDRAALFMINDAEEKGLLKKGGIIVEPTSGNTGIALAAIGAYKGYRVILTMPDTMSRERIQLIKAYGAEIILTEGKLGMTGAVAKAEEIARERGGFIPGQFINPANVKAHYRTTGPEIWRDMVGRVDLFVASVGTGGTLSGAAKYLKEQTPEIKAFAVEPSDSPLLSQGKFGPHKLQGIGANFVPEVLDKTIFDEVVTAETEEAFSCGKALAQTEGILVGISSGAVLAAAVKLSKREEFAGKNIVCVLTDTGERYLSSEMFN